MDTPQGTEIPTLSGVDVKLPPFWTADPALWFIQVESQFAARRITADSTKYHYVVSSLPPSTASEVRDLLLSPSADNVYEALKATLIRRITPSESQRLQQLLHEANLGDRTPSQLLRHMQQLLGSKVDGLDSLLLREIFLQKIPPNVRMVMTASNENDLSKLAELADKLVAVAPTSVAAVTSDPSPHEQLQEMKKEISRLVDSVAALHTASRSTSRGAPQSPTKRQKLCWYHRKFGNAARKCVPPCELSGNAPGRR
ncbi:uncharacterized protein LOC119462607 [Dermacentor silvarum]|uniref:uncharacterized protein LOC119462607 n=1 Tax=Dermacentor silvarum TaxID=543639 RepID=UPI001899DAF9|nr:uncharacterized protein LOC119462607 [Dermacentor silvarum]